MRRELENGARMGDATAIALLNGPEPPDSVMYLLDLADDFVASIETFSWEALRGWRELKDVELLPHEVDAIRTLYVLIRYPDAGEEGAG